MAFQTYAEWQYEVDRQFRVRTGQSWKELGGNEKTLREAFKLKRPPQEFVVAYIERFGIPDHSKNKDWYT